MSTDLHSSVQRHTAAPVLCVMRRVDRQKLTDDIRMLIGRCNVQRCPASLQASVQAIRMASFFLHS